MKNNEILKGLQERPMDFIANNYNKLSKEELRDILLEYIYVADEKAQQEVINSLKVIL